MLRTEALDKNYCLHCASYRGRQFCEYLRKPEEVHLCELSEETIARWKREFGETRDGKLNK